MMALGPEHYKCTPLADVYAAAGARMTHFAGWELPLHFGSQIEEHLAARQGVAIFDVSHMGQIEVSGPQAERLLQLILTQDVGRVAEGASAYSAICNAGGGLIDDVIISRLGAEDFLLVANAATYDRVAAHMRAQLMTVGAGWADKVNMDPCSERWAMIAVQGPDWVRVCRAALGAGQWHTLHPFHVARLEFEDAPLIFSTTGYTGEYGCELLCPPEKAAALWQRLAAAGGRPAGLAARDSLRLEMGYLLSGQDFTGANNPFEVGLDWVVKMEKGEFVGRAALANILKAGISQRLVCLVPEERRIPRPGMAVLAGGRPIGTITSGGYSPSLAHPIAMGFVLAPYAEAGQRLEIDLERGVIPAAVVNRPFYGGHKKHA